MSNLEPIEINRSQFWIAKLPPLLPYTPISPTNKGWSCDIISNPPQDTTKGIFSLFTNSFISSTAWDNLTPCPISNKGLLEISNCLFNFLSWWFILVIRGLGWNVNTSSFIILFLVIVAISNCGRLLIFLHLFIYLIIK